VRAIVLEMSTTVLSPWLGCDYFLPLCSCVLTYFTLSKVTADTSCIAGTVVTCGNVFTPLQEEEKEKAREEREGKGDRVSDLKKDYTVSLTMS